MCFANAGIPVLLKDTKQEALEAAIRTIESICRSSVQKGKIAADEMERRLARIQTQLDYAGFDAADIVVEAVFENIEVKRAVFAELDSIVKPRAVLATNTSYLNIDEIAEASARPERVIGLHFFGPAHVTRLVEVVPGRATEGIVTDAALDLAGRLGKVAVVAGNCPGSSGTACSACIGERRNCCWRKERRRVKWMRRWKNGAWRWARSRCRIWRASISR